MALKVGFNQEGKPAPAWFRRLVSALIIVVVPAFGVLVSQMPATYISNEGKIALGLVSAFVLAVLRAIEIVIGNE